MREDWGREQFVWYWKGAVDLGDTPRGEGEGWVRAEWREASKGGGGRNGDEGAVRGDGTREVLEGVARETGVFLVVGVVERAGGTLYCAVVYVCPRLGGELRRGEHALNFSGLMRICSDWEA